MFLKGRQVRFLTVLLSLWLGGRLALLWSAARPPSPARPPPSAPLVAWSGPERAVAFRPAAWPADRTRRGAAAEPARGSGTPVHPTSRRDAGDASPPPDDLPGEASGTVDPPRPSTRHPPVYASSTILEGPLPPVPAPYSPLSRAAGIEAQAYVYLRPGSGRALASGSALGGSQAAARIAVPVAAEGRIAVAARFYAPLSAQGAEAAVGLDWRPLAALPLRLSVERRQRLETEGRSAWSAYAAGGVYMAPAPHVILDGYAQAGIVGTRRRDLFVDGDLRLERRVLHGGRASVGIGGGLWGAAQPHATRLDAGPRLSVRLPLADHPATLAVEGRFRLAGNARPCSGVAMTLAAGL